MILERRTIRQEEIEVIRATLQRASVQSVLETTAAAAENLIIVARCECGCASVDFDAPSSQDRSKPIADGTGVTPHGGKVGVIVWGRQDTITGLEIYDLGAGDGDLVLPIPASIVSWENSGTG